MCPTRVVVHGALGKMGREVSAALCCEPDMELVGAVELAPVGDFLPLPDGSGQVPLSASPDFILDKCQPDVLVDFSTARAVMPAVRAAAKHGVNLVIGTTGLSADDISEIGQLAEANRVGAVVASNFAIGAVLMMHLAKIAARYLDHAEIIELHHQHKVDAPSGTALSTARAMVAARGGSFSAPQPAGAAKSRGEPVDGISIHSIRLPGLLAHQEIIFGAAGQTLSIRHDAISRECYMPGIIMAVREVVNRQGLVYGLDTLLGL